MLRVGEFRELTSRGCWSWCNDGGLGFLPNHGFLDCHEVVSIPFQNSEQAGEFNEALEEVSVVFPAGIENRLRKQCDPSWTLYLRRPNFRLGHQTSVRYMKRLLSGASWTQQLGQTVQVNSGFETPSNIR